MDEHLKAPNFDIDGLKTFMTVVQCKNFSQAAEILHKTPATISSRIKTLEDQLGMPLFKRTTRNIELLPEGERLLELVSNLYTRLQEIPLELEQLAHEVEPHFVIAVNNLLLTSSNIVPLLADLHAKFPYTRIEVTRCVYMGVWDALMRHEADFSIGVPTWHTIGEAFEALPIGEIRWVFVCSPDHPVTKEAEDPLSDKTLARYLAINVEDTAVTLRKRTAWLVPGQREILVPNMATKLECHLKGLGVGFMPVGMAAPHLKDGTLVTRRVKHPRMPSPVGIALHRNTGGRIAKYLKRLFETNAPIIQPFLEMLKS